MQINEIFINHLPRNDELKKATNKGREVAEFVWNYSKIYTLNKNNSHASV